MAARETKPAYKVGEDGKVYFRYNQGAEYTVTPQVGKPFVYKILSCELDELTGKEYYRIESAGKELSARFSVSQVDFMLSQLPCTQSAAGTAVELPLLIEEVQAFFTKKRKELNKGNVAENAKLKGTKYYSNINAIAAVKDQLRFYSSFTDKFADEKAKLKKRLSELEIEQLKILTEKKVDVKILTKISDCALCGDTGLIGGRICDCARAMTDTVKSYCAAERLAKRG